MMIKLLGIMACLAFLSGCVVATENTPTIDIVQPEKGVVIQYVQVKSIDGENFVTGQINLRSRNSGKPWTGSHVDYTIKNNNGELVDEGAVKYTPNLRFHTRKAPSTFKIKLPEGLSADSTVTIGFHPVEPSLDETNRVSHVDNVLN